MELGTARDGLVVGEERSDGNGGAAWGSLGNWCVGRHRSTQEHAGALELPAARPLWEPGGSLGRACLLIEAT